MRKYDYNYEQPIGAPRQAHHHGATRCNAGFGWNWKGRERATGRVREYFTRGSYGNKQELIDHIEHHFQGIEFIDGAEADKEPSIVMPLPPHSFDHGVMDAMYKEGDRPPFHRNEFRTLPTVILRSSLRAIPKPIVRASITPVIPRGLLKKIN